MRTTLRALYVLAVLALPLVTSGCGSIAYELTGMGWDNEHNGEGTLISYVMPKPPLGLRDRRDRMTDNAEARTQLLSSNVSAGGFSPLH